MMIGADTAGMVSTLTLGMLAGACRQELWHVYVAVAPGAVCANPTGTE